jgi:hypothetical protein
MYADPGTYTVGLTVTDDDGDSSSTTNDVTIAAAYATDTFERTVSNGLGTADSGGPWTLSGATSSFSVASGTGRITAAAGATRTAYLSDVQAMDVDITTDIALEPAATGNGAYVSVIGRRVSNGNEYQLRVRYLAGGSVQVWLTHVVGGTQTVLASMTVPGLTVAPGDTLRARFVITGTATATLRAKLWRTSSAEPAAWLLTNTGATPAVLQAPGGVGIQLYTSGTWSGAAPALTIDNLVVGPPE